MFDFVTREIFAFCILEKFVVFSHGFSPIYYLCEAVWHRVKQDTLREVNMEQRVMRRPAPGPNQEQARKPRSKDRGRGWEISIREMRNRLFKMWTGDPNLNLLIG